MHPTIKQLTCNRTLLFQRFQTGLKPVEKVDQPNQLEKVFCQYSRKTPTNQKWSPEEHNLSVCLILIGWWCPPAVREVAAHRKCSCKRKFNCSLVSNKIACFIWFLQSTPESLFVHHAQMNLLPSHTYSNNSGGDPLCIPDLTVSACIMVNFFGI